ncbi:MAG: PASTA domain-containing protein [Erysipelotrichaceae bacterium]|nr:PASTA domain-containing protein [Erysipelotrichaceae bacterium]
MGWKTRILKKGGKFVIGLVSPDLLEIGTKIGTEFYEQQKALVKIPDLKDVHYEEAIRVLRDELHLITTLAIANPNIAYADESEYKVMYTKPRFGMRVSPGSAVKIYYLTQDVIDKSKYLLGNVIREFKVPIVIGLNIYEARADLEGLGLKVTPKLELPIVSLSKKEDGQVTRITFPNGQKVGSKLKSGDRIWVYYVNDEIISESKAMQIKRINDKQEMMDKFGKVTKDLSKGISSGAVNATKNLSRNLGKFGKNKKKSDIEEQ